jgi:DNA-binding transcriptional regulator YiaG
MRVDIKNARTYILRMSPMLHIRKNVLQLSQARFAEVAGVSQATVSRWERGQWEPNRDELARIRSWAKDNNVDLNDSAFFDATPGRAA